MSFSPLQFKMMNPEEIKEQFDEMTRKMEAMAKTMEAWNENQKILEQKYDLRIQYLEAKIIDGQLNTQTVEVKQGESKKAKDEIMKILNNLNVSIKYIEPNIDIPATP
jgi:DNA mismatch repair ATPase MutS